MAELSFLLSQRERERVCDRVDTCIIKNRVRFCSKVSFGDPQTGIGSL